MNSGSFACSMTVCMCRQIWVSHMNAACTFSWFDASHSLSVLFGKNFYPCQYFITYRSVCFFVVFIKYSFDISVHMVISLGSRIPNKC